MQANESAPPQPNEAIAEAAAETVEYAPAVDEPSTAPLEATDAAKALAAENNIDLATVTGTGADGRITQDDVKALLPEE